MPIYEYRCQACDTELEVLQSISADPLSECPECEAPEGLKRLISQTSFVLKGTGWYVTDYKKTKDPKSPGETKDSSTSDSSTSSSSDAGSSSGTPSKSDSSPSTSSSD